MLRETSLAFDHFFKTAVGHAPFPFQRRFAEGNELPPLVNIPTGLGKTAMAVVGWLWRRLAGKANTPRRLVYCLPMRVLVEQTRDNTIKWIKNLQEANILKHEVAVHLLMGGEDEDDWDVHPEREAIIIGTQDMLLSRALNRGYAASRSRWPMQFGLLHTDCLWVFDEIQLMGAGLATTAQLEAFRHLLGSQDGHGYRSVWMSATLHPEWLKTVDFKYRVGNLAALELGAEDRDNEEVKKRWAAKKPLGKSSATMGDAAEVDRLADEVRKAHKAGTRTIVVVNTVKRACKLHDAIKKELDGSSAVGAAAGSRNRRPRAEPPGADAGAKVSKPELVLLHSRFRPADRQARIAEALAEVDPNGPGTIIVSTQVIEAGVDVSATTLFTELAPWASLVQRFGRCNRRGDDNNSAAVHWIAMPTNSTDAEKVAAPYELDDLNAATEELKKLKDVGLKSLPKVQLRFEHGHVIRRKDLIDLFDTTPDLAGNDIDIDRFVREVEDSDVRVFWRDYGDAKKGATPNKVNGNESEVEPAARREELCPVPVGEFRDFAEKHRGQVWRWDFLEKRWEEADADRIVPGQVFLIHAAAGGYSPERGWDKECRDRVEPVKIALDKAGKTPDATDDDRLSQQLNAWQTLAKHNDKVIQQLEQIIAGLGLDRHAEAEALRRAARWHDRGKAHEVFVAALPENVPNPAEVWAKAPSNNWKRKRRMTYCGLEEWYDRPHFRHELASALAVLLAPEDLIPNGQRDLVAYLVAAHHGKVRLSIRSLPNEKRPEPRTDTQGCERRFARGIWDGDALSESNLGSGAVAPSVTLSLEPMELGLCEQPPFAGQPSWAERMIRLRDTLGPFRLAYLEAILRAADMRASRAAEVREGAKQDPSPKEVGDA